MKIKIDWKQSSTWRGLVWLVTAIIGFIFIMTNKEITDLLLLAAAISGGIGVATTDKNNE